MLIFLEGNAVPETTGWFGAAAFRELLQSFRPDIVHFHHLLLLGVEAIVLVRRVLPQARIVVSLHDYFAICANDGLLRTVADGTPCPGGSIDACHACFPHQDASRFALRRLHLNNVFGEVDRFVAPSAFSPSAMSPGACDAR